MYAELAFTGILIPVRTRLTILFGRDMRSSKFNSGMITFNGRKKKNWHMTRIYKNFRYQ